MDSRLLALVPVLELASGCRSDFQVSEKDTAALVDSVDTEDSVPFVPNDLTPTIQFALQACLRATENPCPTDQSDGTESELCMDAKSQWQTVPSSNAEFRDFQAGGEDSTLLYKEADTSSTTWEDGSPEHISTLIATVGNDPSYAPLFEAVLANSYALSLDLADDLTENGADDEFFVDDSEVPSFVLCNAHKTEEGDIHYVDSFVYLKGEEGSNCITDSVVESRGMRGYCAYLDRAPDKYSTSAQYTYGVYYEGYSCEGYAWNCQPAEAALQSSGPKIEEAFAKVKAADEDGDGIVEYSVE